MKNTNKANRFWLLAIIAIVAIGFSLAACAPQGISNSKETMALRDAVALLQAAFEDGDHVMIQSATDGLVEAFRNWEEASWERIEARLEKQKNNPEALEALIEAHSKTLDEIFVEIFKDAGSGVHRVAVEWFGGGDALAAVIVSPLSDFRYDLTADRRGIRITGYSGRAAIVNIPLTMEDMPVLEIGRAAFEGARGSGRNNSDGIVHITIPYGIEVIRERAYQNQKGISNLIIPESVKEIGEEAFSRMSRLGRATLPDNLKVIPNGLFRDCRNLRTVNLPASLEEIEPVHAFWYCRELNNLIIPDTLTRVRFTRSEGAGGNFAFTGCQKLPIATRQRLESLGYRDRF
jgi:hypothetical protein